MTLWAVVPVKGLDHAKSRLAAVLQDRERQQLARLLLDDTIEALTSCRKIDQVLVVTDHPEVRDRVISAAAHVLPEPTAASEAVRDQSKRASADAVETRSHSPLNRALEAGRCSALASGSTELLTIPIDLILLPGIDLDGLISGCSGDGSASVWLETDDKCDGTNFLLQNPPDSVPFEYGQQSWSRHREAALRAGVQVRDLDIQALRWDLDNPDDPERLANALQDGTPSADELQAAFATALGRGTALPFLLETAWGAPLQAAL